MSKDVYQSAIQSHLNSKVSCNKNRTIISMMDPKKVRWHRSSPEYIHRIEAIARMFLHSGASTNLMSNNSFNEK